MPRLRPLQNYSSFRRIALAQWEPPSKGLIYGTLEVDVTDAESFLEEQRETHGEKVTFGVLVGKAVSIALQAMPEVNARVIGRRIYLKETIDVYYQVDVGGGGDLAGTVIEDADRKKLHEIAGELQERAARIRKGRDEQYEKTQKRGLFRWAPIWVLAWILSFFSFLLYRIGVPAQWLGASNDDPFGSVMVTNVGPFGIDVGYAPLVPWTRVPIVVLVGEVKETPAVVDGEIVSRKILPINATIDHRVCDGAHIGRMCRIIRAFVENPNEEGTVTLGEKTFGGRPDVPESE